MSEVSGKAFDMRLLKRILSYTKPYRGIFNLALFLTIFISILSTSRPILIQYSIDHFIAPESGEGDPRMLLVFTLIMIGILILESVVQFYSMYLTNWLGQSIIHDLRKQLTDHVLKFKLQYFDRTPIGTMVTRVVSDIETIASIFAEGIVVIFGDLFKLVVTIIVMFVYDWRLALLSLAVFPLLLLSARIFQKAIKKAFQDVRTEVARLNAFVQEHLTGMKIVQIFNREEKEFEKFKEINKRHMDANIRSIWHFSIFLPVVEIASAVSMGLLIWWGGIEAATGGKVTLGDLIAFILFVNMMFRPIRTLADRFNTLQMGMVASDRVFKVLDTTDILSNEGNQRPEEVKGHIVFEHVVFGYIPTEPVLKDISFEVKPGKKVALVGATGAGKSSIINLIPRFYDIQEGCITIDGLDIKEWELSHLRKEVSIVLQDVFLFSDSIRNNITLGAEVSDEALEDAAKAIGVHEFIHSLPGGYDYNVRERGAVLSAGQRQLIAFLRAYLSNPSILILDEATSSIDTHTEELVQRAMEKVTENRTSIIIAHRLATVQKADEIIVMDAGRIVERGSHHQLIKKAGYYRKLYELQFEEELA